MVSSEVDLLCGNSIMPLVTVPEHLSIFMLKIDLPVVLDYSMPLIVEQQQELQERDELVMHCDCVYYENEIKTQHLRVEP